MNEVIYVDRASYWLEDRSWGDSMYPVAVILVNYNMPERSDNIAQWLEENIDHPHDLYLVDNGSDIKEPSRYTTVRLEENVQTTRGWLEGLKASDGRNYFAYWIMITSMKPVSRNADMLGYMVTFLVNNPNAVGIHPALTRDSTTAWGHMKIRDQWEPRRTWMMDNIAALYRADWFNSIGRFDPALTYAWGSDLETCYKAREQGRSLWIDDRFLVRKDTNIGYKMERMGMDAEERENRARNNMREVLSEKYGPDWDWKMRNEFVEEGWR